MRRLYVWLVIVMAVAGAIAATVVAYAVTRPCTPGGVAANAGDRLCTVPLPSPTTLIAAGTVFTIAANQYVSFQFHPAPATSASVTGSFASTHVASINIMTPSEFFLFSADPAKFQCPSIGSECFTTGNVSAGSVNISFLPIYRPSSGNVSNVNPWFLVMQNVNATANTNITWVTSLVSNYNDITASESMIAHTPPTMRAAV